jgi:hypothetical protein
MLWYNLTKNRCPKESCKKELDPVSVPGFIVCSCGFSVRPEKMQRIVSSIVGQDIERSQIYKQELDEPYQRIVDGSRV